MSDLSQPANEGPRLTFFQRINLALLLTAVCLMGFFWMDRAVANRPLAAQTPTLGATGAAHPGYSRVFVIVLDSLRYETAMDAETMPNLAALRATSVHAKMNTVYEGFTAPAIRAAFSGQVHTSIASVISNFHHADLRIESIFSQAADAGLATADFSEGHFKQFGNAVENCFSPPSADEDRVALDRRLLLEAVELFKDPSKAIVVAHVQMTDEIAHEVGIHHPGYRDCFQLADTWVGEVEKRLPSDVTLVVIGDHGHDERGAHKTGLDIPTYACVKGPGFAQGYDLGTIEIADVRYFLNWSLKLPLDQARHDARRLRQALVRPDQFASFAEEVATHADEPGRSGQANGGWWLALVVIAALAFIPLVPGVTPSPATALLPWISMTPVLLGAPYDVPLVIGCAVTTTVWLLVNAGLRRYAVCLIGIGAVLIGVHFWGRGVILLKALPPLAPWHLTLGWIAVWSVGGYLLRFCERTRLVWVIAAIAGLVVYPAIHVLGMPAQSAVGPVMLTWFAGWAASCWRDTRSLLWVAGGSLVFAWFFNQYGTDSAGGLRFTVPTGMEMLVPLAVLTVIAKSTCLVCGWRRERPWLVTACVVLLLTGLQWKVLPGLVAVENQRWVFAGVLALLGAGWVAFARNGRDDPAWVCGTGLFFALYYFCMQSQTYHYAWLDLLAFGFVAAARVLRMRPPHTTGSADYGLLLTSAWLATYYITTAWVEGGVEWRVIYWWFPAGIVERNVVWFVPFIAFKMVMPFCVIRRLLARQLAPAGAQVRWGVLAATGVFVTAILIYSTGLAAVSPTPEIFMPQAETIAAFLVLFVFLALTT